MEDKSNASQSSKQYSIDAFFDRSQNQYSSVAKRRKRGAFLREETQACTVYELAILWNPILYDESSSTDVPAAAVVSRIGHSTHKEMRRRATCNQYSTRNFLPGV